MRTTASSVATAPVSAPTSPFAEPAWRAAEAASDPTLQPVTLALSAFQGRFTTEFNTMAAAAVIICLPILVLYAFFQRQFIHGVLSGAIKE